VVFELVDPDVVWTAIEGAPDAGTYRGLESVRAYMQDWLEEFDFDDGEYRQIERSIEVGSVLCAFSACVYTFGDDERIVEVNEYATLDGALEAASPRPTRPTRQSRAEPRGKVSLTAR
jgi:hypothetical protein